MPTARRFDVRWLTVLVGIVAAGTFAGPAAGTSGAEQAGPLTFALIEGGATWCGYNDVAIPRDSGTRFSLTEDLATDPGTFVRIRLGARLGNRHSLSLLAAPLRLNAEGRLSRPVSYQGVDFPANEELRATYRFDSYRLTYRYTILRSVRTRLDIGLTAKIRDAEIEVSSGDQYATKTDTGFVPLLSFAFCWNVAQRWSLVLDGDALASPGGQGRAEDVFVGLHHTLSGGLAWRAGYRILEGGADVPEVYNFTLIHYAAVAFMYSLPR